MSRRVVALLLWAVSIAASTGEAAITSGRTLPTDWRERESIFEQIRGKKSATDEDKLLAIDLLQREDRFIHSNDAPRGLGEAYGDYYIDLALFVKNLRDPRSITALSGAVDVAGSISTTLAEFGDAAVDAVASRLTQPVLAADAVFTLGKFVEGRRIGKNHLSDPYQTRIRKLLLDATASSDAHVRLEAATALQYFPGDAEVAAALRRLAASDMYVHSSARKRKERRPTDYPVRQAAKNSLAIVERRVSP